MVLSLDLCSSLFRLLFFHFKIFVVVLLAFIAFIAGIISDNLRYKL